MLNHVYNNHLYKTDDGGQAIGEEVRCAQMSRQIMHIGERSKQQYTRVMRRDQCNERNISEQKQEKKQCLSTKIIQIICNHPRTMMDYHSCIYVPLGT